MPLVSTRPFKSFVDPTLFSQASPNVFVTMFGQPPLIEQPVDKQAVAVTMFGQPPAIEQPVDKQAVAVTMFGQATLIEQPVANQAVAVGMSTGA